MSASATPPVGIAWWDDVPYDEDEGQPFTMEIIAPSRFSHPCGFIQLRERHKVKAERSPINAFDRHCRIGKVTLKEGL